MKKGFLKNNWPTMLVVLLFIVASIYIREPIIIIATVIFVLLLVMNYRKYDSVEQDNNEWWQDLSKEDKLKIKERGL